MRSIAEILQKAGEGGIHEAALRFQMRESGESADSIRHKMKQALDVMRQAAKDGLSPALRSASGQVGGQAAKLLQSPFLADFGLAGRAAVYALAIAECNACMGKIVAAPTAGSCGVLPAALLSWQEAHGTDDEQLVDALLTAAAIGRAIAINASISGAEGGCQAECGAAAAMAAAALCELMGGTPRQSADAAAYALMNLLGLVCDPVGGLVEVPCVYRNIGAVSVALSSAQLAMAVPCPLPCDEVILAMKDVGDSLPPSLRETGEGGCAACASARRCAGQ